MKDRKFKSVWLNLLVILLAASCLGVHVYRLISEGTALLPTDKVLTGIYIVCFLLIISYALFHGFKSADFFTWMVILLGAVTVYTQILFPEQLGDEWICVASKVVALLVYGGLISFLNSWINVKKCNRIILFTAVGLLFNELLSLAAAKKIGGEIDLFDIYECVSPLVILLVLALCYWLRMSKKKPSQENL